MTATIERLVRYPLKSAQGKTLFGLHVRKESGVAEDRRWAIPRDSDAPVEWRRKSAFYAGANEPRIAKYQPVFNAYRNDELAQDLDPRFVREIRIEFGIEDRYVIHDSKGLFAFADTQGPFVSFLNLATVDALSAHMGIYIDPRRFRMNVWLKGLDPFEELTWVDKYPGTKQIRVGSMWFRVDDACERCKAIEANPDTGTYDLSVLEGLRSLMESRRYKSPHRRIPQVMGLLAAPLESRLIFVGDPVTV